MVIVNDGKLLNWQEIHKNLEQLRSKSLDQLMKIYNKYKDIQNDPFKWGDEIEYSIVRFDHEAKKVQLLLKSEKFFDHIAKLKEKYLDENDDLSKVDFHAEYTSYIIETIPSKPNDDNLNKFDCVQENMKLRRQIIQKFLDENEYVIPLTCFPQLGCSNFTYPSHNPVDSDQRTKYDSYYYSNDIIMKRALFKSATCNKIDRKQSLPHVYVPVYKDKNTLDPFKEDNLNDKCRDDFIHLDHDGFAMGCCCIQATFQAESLEQACHLYDQLTPIAPVVLALSASSPVWKGYLADMDCRWNVLKQAFDDRSREELGLEPLNKSRFILRRSRFDTTDVYLSEEGSKYNLAQYDRDDSVYERLTNEGMSPELAEHFASMFTRDPYAVLEEDLNNFDEDFVGNFDMLNSTNWRLLRFKPPPFSSAESENRIGWRVEFRPTELQLTDFHNAAFATFIILLTKTILKFNLNFLIDTIRLDENMTRASRRNAYQNEKFYFRVNVENSFGEEAQVEELSANEIINGNSKFKGLVPLVKEYLNQQELNTEARDKLDKYLSLFEQRACGKLLTTAAYIRKFINEHPKYNHDSKISDEINYDLMWRLYQISNNDIECPELIV